MNIAKMSPEQIGEAGMRALVRDLGPGGFVRFLQLFDVGRGDYTAERAQSLPDASVQDFASRIRAARPAQE